MYFCVMVSVKAQVVCKHLLLRTDLTVQGNTSLYILSGYFSRIFSSRPPVSWYYLVYSAGVFPGQPKVQVDVTATGVST